MPYGSIPLIASIWCEGTCRDSSIRRNRPIPFCGLLSARLKAAHCRTQRPLRAIQQQERDRAASGRRRSSLDAVCPGTRALPDPQDAALDIPFLARSEVTDRQKPATARYDIHDTNQPTATNLSRYPAKHCQSLRREHDSIARTSSEQREIVCITRCQLCWVKRAASSAARDDHRQAARWQRRSERLHKRHHQPKLVLLSGARSKASV